jgi:hypothetical protein
MSKDEERYQTIKLMPWGKMIEAFKLAHTPLQEGGRPFDVSIDMETVRLAEIQRRKPKERP